MTYVALGNRAGSLIRDQPDLCEYLRAALGSSGWIDTICVFVGGVVDGRRPCGFFRPASSSTNFQRDPPHGPRYILVRLEIALPNDQYAPAKRPQRLILLGIALDEVRRSFGCQ